MTQSTGRVSIKAGLPPGSLIHVGEAREIEPRITVIDYTPEHATEQEVHTVDDIVRFRDTDSVTWVNVEGLSDVGIIEDIGTAFDIHPLVLEDILNTQQRPKFEQHEDYLFLVFKVIYPAEDGLSINYEQLSILIFERFVFTFKEKRDDFFVPIAKRLHNHRGRFRLQGVDYLAYTILDTVVDHYLSMQDYLDEIVETVEDDLLTDPDVETLATIQRIRRELIFIRRSVSPLRELLSGIQRSDSPLIGGETLIYYRDIEDHVLRVTDAIDTYRDILTGLLDVYNSTVSNRMNEIMKVLTVFASIFIPLTFLAGVYGMNFKHMPELGWEWSYPLIWLTFVIIAATLLVYFKRKKWL